jgi:hypothetical protein
MLKSFKENFLLQAFPYNWQTEIFSLNRNLVRLKQKPFSNPRVRFLLLSFVVWPFLSFLPGCAISNRSIEERRQEVAFTYQGDYRSVCLSGDFNDWATDSHCLRRNGETWEIELPLSPGRYRYGFILDGSLWVTDPKALLIEEDGFGRKNSVIVVE